MIRQIVAKNTARISKAGGKLTVPGIEKDSNGFDVGSGEHDRLAVNFILLLVSGINVTDAPCLSGAGVHQDSVDGSIGLQGEIGMLFKLLERCQTAVARFHQ